jgi:hypothetical protein
MHKVASCRYQVKFVFRHQKVYFLWTFHIKYKSISRHLNPSKYHSRYVLKPLLYYIGTVSTEEWANSKMILRKGFQSKKKKKKKTPH